MSAIKHIIIAFIAMVGSTLTGKLAGMNGDWTRLRQCGNEIISETVPQQLPSSLTACLKADTMS